MLEGTVLTSPVMLVIVRGPVYFNIYYISLLGQIITRRYRRYLALLLILVHVYTEFRYSRHVVPVQFVQCVHKSPYDWYHAAAWATCLVDALSRHACGDSAHLLCSH
jgi:hypothetical protein